MYTFAVLFSVSPHFFAANVFKRSIKCWVMRAWLFEESCTFLRRIGRLRGISSLIPLGRIFSRRRITRLIGIIPLGGVICLRRHDYPPKASYSTEPDESSRCKFGAKTKHLLPNPSSTDLFVSRS